MTRAIGAAEAQVPYKHKVSGSNPLSPTRNTRDLKIQVSFLLQAGN
jgi:hypothetical protein